MNAPIFDVIIIGTGPAGIGAAFHLIENRPSLKILLLDRAKICSGGLLNDCKQNYTYPIGFAVEHWTAEEADAALTIVRNHLKPSIKSNTNLEMYRARAARLGVSLVDVKQSHVGTDKSRHLILGLMTALRTRGVEIRLQTEVTGIVVRNGIARVSIAGGRTLSARTIVVAPGRKGFSFLQYVMEQLGIGYIDNFVDVGVRIETRLENYPIVGDYYDPKFYLANKVRTFCTNSGHALVFQEKYQDFFLVNGHSLSTAKGKNGLVNLALLKTIGLQNPVRSGQQMGIYLARLANEIGGGRPLMQRVGDFRMGKRSSEETFNLDLYNFKPTCSATAGDLGLAVPSKIMRDIWSALKQLDTIIPGLLHPSTIMYYPEIKMYATKPEFIDRHFKVRPGIYMIGDGAGTSRGITGAWASGIRAAEGILKELV
jgi:uncharacterized protein